MMVTIAGALATSRRAATWARTEKPDHAMVLVLTPWLGLVAAVVLVIAWGADLLQHGRSLWPACVTAAGLYLVPLVVSCMLLP
jgi:hypothetical protein